MRGVSRCINVRRKACDLLKLVSQLMQQDEGSYISYVAQIAYETVRKPYSTIFSRHVKPKTVDLDIFRVTVCAPAPAP